MRGNRSFGTGLLVGVAGTLAAAALLGVGGRAAADNWFITSGHDGRTAYLWEQAGGSLRCVATAEAQPGKGGDQKNDDNAGGDDGKGKDKDKGGKPDDKGNKPDDKGKGKGKGGVE